MTNEMLSKLRDRVSDEDRLLVAYSGGADSAFLAAVAADVLGDAAVAVTAVSPSLPQHERRAAREFARAHGIRQLEICTDEGDRPEYVSNDGNRCYHCKSALFDAIAPLTDLLGARVALGTNLDDLGDHRPGHRAATEHGAIAPLVDAGFTKAAVREASRRLGLETADKPAAACLASRVAYGEPVTPELLGRIEQAEDAVHDLGFPSCRVRAHADGTVARLEVPLSLLPRAIERREELHSSLIASGFLFAAVDLAGLSSGGMNVLLEQPRRRDRHPAPHGRQGSEHGRPVIADLGFSRVDVDREQRHGIPEVIYAPGKDVDEIVAIAAQLLDHNDGPVMVTRIDDDAAVKVASQVPGAHCDPTARILSWRPAPTGDFTLLVVSAGTADGAVAAEAVAVARAVGLDVVEQRDVGVAGLHRLLAVTDDLHAADAIVVVAGMEGALASAVGGLVGCPVIAVPTSTGYGAALDGITALLAMLTSCAPGLSVVNIDSGFGAAMAAHRLARASMSVRSTTRREDRLTRSEATTIPVTG